MSRFRARDLAPLACLLGAVGLPGESAARQAPPPERLAGLVLDGRLDEWGRAGIPGIARTASGRLLVLGVRTREPMLAQVEGSLSVTWSPPDADRRLHWEYSSRTGSVGPSQISASDAGVRVHPTVRSSTFELGFDAEALGALLGVGPTDPVGFRLADGETTLLSGEISWPEPPPAMRPGRGIPTLSPGTLRVVAWNVESNGLFHPDRRASIGRVLGSLNADLLVLQEVYDSTAVAVASALDTLLPRGSGSGWKVRKAGDVVLASRDSLGRAVDTGFHDFGRAAAATWHVPGRSAILVVGAHLPCCNGGSPPADRRRAFLLRRMASMIADLSRLDEADTPALQVRLVVGDLNLVGEADALDPLVRPGGDGGRPPFVVLDALHLDREETYTWFGPGGGFAPGRLDYALVDSASESRVERAFVLDDGDLEGAGDAGILGGDVSRASDHLPLVIDLIPPPPR